MKIKRTHFLLLAVLIAPSAESADYYVSSIRSGRSDSNAGTNPNAPWATFDKVKSAWGGLSAGDTVHLERGSTWNVSFSSDYWNIRNGGNSSGGYITLRGDDYGSGSMPIVKRTSGTGASAFLLIQSSYVVMKGFELDGGNRSTSGAVIVAEQSSLRNIQILDMYIHNLGGSSSAYICGIWMASWSDGVTITDCLFEGNYISDYSAHGLNHYSRNPMYNIIWRNNVVKNSFTGGRYPSANSALQITSGGTGCIFEHNWLEDTTTTEGNILAFGKYGDDLGFNSIRFNVLVNSPTYGILFTIDHRDKKINYNIYGNIFYNNARSGIAIHPYDSYKSGTRFNIYNNTFYNNCTAGGDTTRGDIELEEKSINTVVDVANNLIFHRNYSSTVGLAVDNGFKGSLTHRNNLYWHEGGTSKNIILHNQTYTVANALSYESTAQNTTPLFKNTSQPPTAISYDSGATPDGLSVLPGSPAIGAGANLGSTYALDINRNTRTTPWTIGAYQAGGAPPVADTTAPTVSLSAPADGTTVSGSAITVSAAASDNVGVVGVQFQLDGANLGAEDTAAPYTVSWNTTGTANGSHILTAVARDAAGNSKTSAGVAVTVNNVPLPADAITSTTDSWQNMGFVSQNAKFTAEFDAAPKDALIDGITGLALGSAADYDDLAVIVRFNDSGRIDARNGDTYTADAAVAYTANTIYHIRAVVDISTHTYSVYVQEGSNPEIQIADNYAFRTAQNSVTGLDTLALTAVTGSHWVSNLTITQPVITPAPPGMPRVITNMP